MTAHIVDIIASDWIETAWPLLVAHEAELAIGEPLPIEPDVGLYRKLEAAGLLVSLGAFEDGLLIGYSVNTVAPDVQHGAVVVLSNMLFYVDPGHRGGTLGARLMLDTETAGSERGAAYASWHAKPDTPMASILLKRPDYVLTDLVFRKVL